MDSKPNMTIGKNSSSGKGAIRPLSDTDGEAECKFRWMNLLLPSSGRDRIRRSQRPGLRLDVD